MEEWKDIKGYDGKYRLSNTGKVESTNYNNTGKPKELKLKRNKYGFNEVMHLKLLFQFLKIY